MSEESKSSPNLYSVLNKISEEKSNENESNKDKNPSSGETQIKSSNGSSSN